MTLRALTGTVLYPSLPPIAESMGLTSFLIDASGEKLAMGFHYPKAGTVHKVGFVLGTVTTWQNLKVSFQDPDLATGDPDGVVDQFRVVTGADTDDNLWKLTGILSSDGTDNGTKRTVTKGERGFVVIEFDSTIGNLSIGAGAANVRARFVNSAFVDHFTAAWAKANNATPILYLEYSDGTTAAINGVWPFTTITTSNITDTTNPDEIGIRFTVPWRCSVDGAWACPGLGASTASFTLKLYDSAQVLLTSVTVDPDFSLETSSVSPGVWLFPAEQSLEPNTVYYLTIRATGAGNVGVRYCTLDTASVLNAWDGGSAVRYVERQNDTGTFAETTTRRPMMGLRISSLEDGTGTPSAGGSAAGSTPTLTGVSGS